MVAFGFEDSLVAVVISEGDLDRAIVAQFGRAVAADFVDLVESGPCEEDHRGAVAEIEAGLQGAKGYLAVVVGPNGVMAGPLRLR